MGIEVLIGAFRWRPPFPSYSDQEEREFPNPLLVSCALALVKLAYRDPWTGRECKRLVLLETDLVN